MAKAYTRDDIIGAALHRFTKWGVDATNLVDMYEAFYDEVGKDKFRTYASVDAQAMQDYFNQTIEVPL